MSNSTTAVTAEISYKKLASAVNYSPIFLSVFLQNCLNTMKLVSWNLNQTHALTLSLSHMHLHALYICTHACTCIFRELSMTVNLQLLSRFASSENSSKYTMKLKSWNLTQTHAITHSLTHTCICMHSKHMHAHTLSLSHIHKFCYLSSMAK